MNKNIAVITKEEVEAMTLSQFRKYLRKKKGAWETYDYGKLFKLAGMYTWWSRGVSFWEPETMFSIDDALIAIGLPELANFSRGFH